MTAPNPIPLSFLGAVEGSWTGSMSAGSAVLTLTSADHPIKVGHDVIVQIGGEAGAGARATVGVGGTWPATSYPTEADLIASGAPSPETQDDGSATAAYVEDTAAVYYWGGSEWIQVPDHIYESAQFLPLALVATVIDVDGAALTLSATATVATSGATVYVDCYRAMNQALWSDGSRVRVDGEYAVGRELSIDISGADGVVVFGDNMDSSKLFNPRGCPWLRIRVFDSDDFEFSDLELERKWTNAAIWKGYTGYLGASIAQPHVLGANTSDRVAIQNVRVRNGIIGSVSLSQCDDGAIRGEVSVHDSGLYLRHYTGGWDVQAANCARCAIVNCNFEAPYASESVELFRCTDSYIDGFVSTNGSMSSNSNIRCDYRNISVLIENTAGPEREASIEQYRPQGVLNWNRNFLDVAAEGGTIENVRLEISASAPAEIATQIPQLFVRHSALASDLDPITMGPGVELVTNGMLPQALEAVGSDVQQLQMDGVTADAEIELTCATVDNVTGTTLRKCQTNVTLGSGNSFSSIVETCP